MTLIEYLEQEITNAETEAKLAKNQDDFTMNSFWLGVSSALRGVLIFLLEN